MAASTSSLLSGVNDSSSLLVAGLMLAIDIDWNLLFVVDHANASVG
jgi:hypothetical protein